MEGFGNALSGSEANAVPDTMPDSFLMSTLYLIFAAAFITIMIIAIVSCLRLLMSIRRDESPFTERNGGKIRTIGIAFMLLEPCSDSINACPERGVFRREQYHVFRGNSYVLHFAGVPLRLRTSAGIGRNFIIQEDPL